MKKQEAKRVAEELWDWAGDPAQNRFHSRSQMTHYIRMQQTRAILYKQLKVPSAIGQFTQALDQQVPTQLSEEQEGSAGGLVYYIIKGKARLVHRKACITVSFTQINLEDKGALAKLVEAIRTRYSDRYAIYCHWEGNVLGPN
ncbi:hypothetical protein U0070_008836, partial [Myodes glareolus]